MCVQRSGYYSYLNKLLTIKKDEDLCLVVEIKTLSKLSRNSYGNRRIAKGLQAKGYNIGRYRVRRLMRRAGIECRQRRRYRVTTNSTHSLPIASNILNRAFAVTKPNKVWAADITHLWTEEGWLYIAAVLDLFSRRIVGWAMDKQMKVELVHKALRMAIGRRDPDNGLMHHSDRGSQYASIVYQELLRDNGITVSMSRSGNCWDNAVMERFFGSMKSEYTDVMRYETRREAMADVINYIEVFYNNQRLHSALGYISPMQYEQKWNN